MSVGALDSATISQLKADAANRPDQNLDEVSRRFEELFVNMQVFLVQVIILTSPARDLLVTKGKAKCVGANGIRKKSVPQSIQTVLTPFSKKAGKALVI